MFCFVFVRSSYLYFRLINLRDEVVSFYKQITSFSFRTHSLFLRYLLLVLCVCVCVQRLLADRYDIYTNDDDDDDDDGAGDIIIE